jgi:hypothetical protein
VAVKLLRCSAEWVKIGGHPCWRVEKALQDMGIEYERVPGSPMPWQRGRRTELIEKSGGNRYPAIEFENGRVYREESKDMERTVRAGRLFEKAGEQGGAAGTSG